MGDGIIKSWGCLKAGYLKSNGKKNYFILIFPIKVPHFQTLHAMILDGPGSGFAMGSGLNSHGTVSARRQIQKPHSELFGGFKHFLFSNNIWDNPSH
jgi:hypothetical protein